MLRVLVVAACLAVLLASMGGAYALGRSHSPPAVARSYERTLVRVMVRTDELAARLAEGWEVERTDRLPDPPALVYVLRRPR